jgi:hypothetical protein
MARNRHSGLISIMINDTFYRQPFFTVIKGTNPGWNRLATPNYRH